MSKGLVGEITTSNEVKPYEAIIEAYNRAIEDSRPHVPCYNPEIGPQYRGVVATVHVPRWAPDEFQIESSGEIRARQFLRPQDEVGK